MDNRKHTDGKSISKRGLSRRNLLKSIGVGSLGGIAGCVSVETADGDGSDGGNDGGSNGGSDGDDGGSGDGSGDGGDGTGNGGDGSDGDGDGDGGGTPSPKGTIKIGILQPLSGTVAYYGKQSIWGFYSGLAYKYDKNPVKEAKPGKQVYEGGDVTYEMYIADTEFNKSVAQEKAIELVQNDNVDILFGCVSSGSAQRVINRVVRGTGTPFIVGAASSSAITSNSNLCNERVFRANENTPMVARSMGKYISQETEIERMYLLGADYSYGQEAVRNYKDVFADQGIEVIGTKLVPQGYTEFRGILDNIEKNGAEGITGSFTVRTASSLFTSFLAGNYDMRLFGPFADRLTIKTISQVIGNVFGDITKEKIDEKGLGPWASRYHWNQYENNINLVFKNMYINNYGLVPDLFTSGTFTAASALVQAVNETGSTEIDDIVEAMRGMTVEETPKGKNAYTFQKYNNQARSEITVAPMVPNNENRWGVGIMPGEPVSRIAKDQTTIPKSSSYMKCEL